MRYPLQGSVPGGKNKETVLFRRIKSLLNHNLSYPTNLKSLLNDCQFTGPKLQTDLPTVLNRFRRFKFLFEEYSSQYTHR